MADTPIKDAVKRMCDEIFRASFYAETFEVVDDDFNYPYVTYFNGEGDALRINHLTGFTTFFPGPGVRLGIRRTVPVEDLRSLLYALEGAALSIYAQTHDPETTYDEVTIEGNNLFELFTNLLARHQDGGTQEHFQAELKRFEGKE